MCRGRAGPSCSPRAPPTTLPSRSSTDRQSPRATTWPASRAGRSRSTWPPATSRRSTVGGRRTGPPRRVGALPADHRRTRRGMRSYCRAHPRACTVRPRAEQVPGGPAFTGGYRRRDRTRAGHHHAGRRRRDRLRIRQRHNRLRGDDGQGGGRPRCRSRHDLGPPVARGDRCDHRAPAVAGHDAGTKLDRRLRQHRALRATAGPDGAWPPTTRGTSWSAVQDLADAGFDVDAIAEVGQVDPERSVGPAQLGTHRAPRRRCRSRVEPIGGRLRPWPKTVRCLSTSAVVSRRTRSRPPWRRST